MAQANDSVTITPGTGAVIATHLAGGKEHQVMVLADQAGNLDPTRVVSGTVAVSNLPGTQPVSGTVTANAGTGNFAIKPYTPATADILTGSITVTNSATETTIITIPANRTWVGTVNVDTVWTGTASTAVKFAHIRTLGAGVTPAAGTVLLRVNTTTAGNNQSGQITVTAPVGNAVTITITAGGAVTQIASGSAFGVLL